VNDLLITSRGAALLELAAARHWQAALRARPVVLTRAGFDCPFCFLNKCK